MLVLTVVRIGHTVLTCNSASNKFRPRMYHGGIIVTLNFCNGTFRSLRLLGKDLSNVGETCFVCTEFDGRLRHDFEHIEAVSCDTCQSTVTLHWLYKLTGVKTAHTTRLP